MKTLTLGILFLLADISFAQITDNFNDSDLLSTPQWSGQLSSFSTMNGELHSVNNSTNSLFYISTPCTVSSDAEWRIDVKLLFNTSSLNYVDLVVMSDSSDITRMKNGYFIRMGGTSDEISLYKTLNGADTRIIDGADNILNSSNNQWLITLTRQFTGSFILQRCPLSGGQPVTEGMAMDSDFIHSSFYGIRVRQSTSSFFGKHYFDNLYAGRIIKDTSSPLLNNVVVLNDTQLECIFSEDCDSLDLTNISNFTILQGNINPVSISAINGKRVLLNFQHSFSPNTWLNLRIKDIADKAKNIITPVTSPFYYSKPDTALFRDLLITELLPDPDPVVNLPNREYVEITNISKRFIQLKGCKIHDPSSNSDLPDMILAPDSMAVIMNIPSLNNSGDRIWITNQKGEIIHSVEYTDAWYKDNAKKNGGWSLEMIDMNNVCAADGNWKASIHPNGGTPGSLNSVKGILPPDTKALVIVSMTPFNDSIIHLRFDERIDSLNSLNCLFSVDGRTANFKLIGYSANRTENMWLIDFNPHPNSIYSIICKGIKDCSGNSASQQFDIQWPSLSKRNELVFNEILFNPKTGGYDFIEIYNNTSKTFDLNKHFIAVLDEKNQYKSIDKLSATPLYLKPHQYLLLSADTSKVCEQYQCKEENALFIQFNKMPSLPDDAGNLLILNMSGKVVDSIIYSETWHFPLLSDKEGVSLERISFTASATSPDNWHSAASVAGFATPGYLNSQANTSRKSDQYFTLQNKTVSPDEDGFEDVLILNYNLPAQDYMANIMIYDTEGRLVSQWVNNETLGTEGFVAWNGTDYKTQKAAIGMYILAIECTHPDGHKIREKMSFTVAAQF